MKHAACLVRPTETTRRMGENMNHETQMTAAMQPNITPHQLTQVLIGVRLAMAPSMFPIPRMIALPQDLKPSAEMSLIHDN